MFESFSVDVQAYVFSLVVGITAPLLLFGMLRTPLRHFLHAIFYNTAIERFWIRVVLIAMLIGSVSTAVGYCPADLADEDFIVLIWNLADEVQSILQTLLFSMVVLFLPLLLSYTILHMRRDRSSVPDEDKEES